jgi:hypothetical protein
LHPATIPVGSFAIVKAVEVEENLNYTYYCHVQIRI